MLRKAIICLLLAAFLAIGAVASRWSGEFGDFCENAAPVLMYHDVGPAKEGWPKALTLAPELFERQLSYLKGHGFAMVTVEELAARLERGETVNKYVALSFDDGYKSSYTVVLPLLLKYGAKASFFIVNNDIGAAGYMDEGEIKELIASGMELGSHTFNHTALAKTASKHLVWELDTSRYYLKKKFDGYIVRTLAYPNGSYNGEVVAAARKYGFYRALTGHVGVNTPATYAKAPMEMYRVTVADDGDGLEGFERRLKQAYLFGFLATKGLDINKLRDMLVE